MGLFSFSQYDLLNKSQRPRLQRARSHRCHRQPPDSAFAHGNLPRPLDATDSRRTAPARKVHPLPPQDRLKTTSEAQKQIFGPYCNFFAIADCRGAPNRGSQPKNTANRPLNGSSPPCREVRGSAIAKKLQKSPIFCFYEAILRDKTNFQRPDHHNEVASQRTDCLSQKIPQRQIATTASNSAKGGSPQP